MLRAFCQSRSGNFAIMSGLTMIPIVLAVGFGIDYGRYSSAQRHLQEMADATSLALAASRETNQAKLEALAADYLDANRSLSRVDTVRLVSVDATKEEVDVRLAGSIPATFMSVAGYEQLNVAASALAERAIQGNVEVSLVLDNTWSMVEADASGTKRIDALKSAAASLVEKLLKDSGTSVRIALVPYADYVNVGIENRGAPWLDIGVEKTTQHTSGGDCWTVTEKTECTAWAPKKTCTRTRDGVTETYSCGGGCTATRTTPVTPYQQCSKERSWTTTIMWHGCVGSRTGGTNRLHDGNTSVRYPGFTSRNPECLNPIVRLTNDKAKLLAAISGMIINRGGYTPSTFIPAGLIWGLNTLSPTAPFPDGMPYDDGNQRPRKVAVLMTDGENTLLYDSRNGRHKPSGVKSLSPGEAGSGGGRECGKEEDDDDDDEDCGVGAGGGSGPYKQSNRDTLSICAYMKSKEIEIYTVAFMVEDDTARAMLQRCASSPDHYYEAADSVRLSAAFGGIAEALRVVRLAR